MGEVEVDTTTLPPGGARVRFEASYELSSATGCWIWRRAFSHGYGHLQVSRRRVYAHRLAYELYVGPIPPGRSVEHHCQNRACVNPRHLTLGPQRESMNRRIDLVGRRFGHVTVLAYAGALRWRCRCDCEIEWTPLGYGLRSGDTQRCDVAGCPTRPPYPYIKHGYARGRKHRPEYYSWLKMKDRCLNPRHRYYANYGGRGIVICDRWRDSFAAFLADMGERPAGMSLDRIDVDGHYEPGNCRWATKQEQCENRRPGRRRGR